MILSQENLCAYPGENEWNKLNHSLEELRIAQRDNIVIKDIYYPHEYLKSKPVIRGDRILYTSMFGIHEAIAVNFSNIRNMFGKLIVEITILKNGKTSTLPWDAGSFNVRKFNKNELIEYDLPIMP
jgi:hypothetical protein